MSILPIYSMYEFLIGVNNVNIERAYFYVSYSLRDRNTLSTGVHAMYPNCHISFWALGHVGGVEFIDDQIHHRLGSQLRHWCRRPCSKWFSSYRRLPAILLAMFKSRLRRMYWFSFFILLIFGMVFWSNVGLWWLPSSHWAEVNHQQQSFMYVACCSVPSSTAGPLGLCRFKMSGHRPGVLCCWWRGEEKF